MPDVNTWNRFLAAVFVMAVATLGAACTDDADSAAQIETGESESDAGGSEMVTLTAADSGTTRTVAVGDVIEVRLEAIPGTGFEWVALDEPDPDQPALIVETERRYVPESEDEGSPGQEVIRFRAEATGSATITLGYRQPWEADVEPEETVLFEVTITD